jgi:SAM-dependent methyltransferase
MGDASQPVGPTDNDVAILLRSGITPHRIALEDYVAFQWEEGQNLLGQRYMQRRDAIALGWLRDATVSVGEGASVLDVGCAYGDHLFALNAMLGKPRTVEMLGIDLDEKAVHRANVFARTIPGYANCRFQVADIARGLPFPDDSFSAINFSDVLEHLADPRAALEELRRVARPRAIIVISTPLRDSVFKRAAAFANGVFGGRLYRAYYSGKGAALDERGRPFMETQAGFDHISEMTLLELEEVCAKANLTIEETVPMSVMSGSRWFDEHGFLLASLLLLETLHEKLRRPSWAHSVMLRVRSV